ncbi:MAG TPA: HU family DNA-binding protein [Bacteroidia bacterium]|jgi:DNA-binding protein HU-beta|nr:HU family DNA-binding protein [Bacteroidia bacterium]
MTKAELVNEISVKTGVEKLVVQQVVESTMKVIKGSLTKGENVYMRGFGSFICKKRAEKTGRIITKNITIIIPEHYIPAFKPAKTFAERVKNNVKVVKEEKVDPEDE